MEGATIHVVARPRGRSLVAGIGVVAAIGLCAWPFATPRSPGGGDWSWVAALAYAAHHGLNFGHELVWSFGPLGFLNTWGGPVLYYGDVYAIAWLYAAVIQFLLAATLLVALRRTFPLALAAPLAVVVLALVSERPTALGFAWCALMLTRGDNPPRDVVARWFPVAIGVLTGVAVLGKLNNGVELLVLAVIALAAAPRRRDLLAFVGAWLATALAGWLLSGQVLTDLWAYLRNSAEVVAGYAAAMGTNSPSHRWTYVAAVPLAALALALAWSVVRAARPLRRWCLLALCAIYLVFSFKESFVRQDIAHLEVFFGSMLVLLAMLPVRARLRPLTLGGLLASVAALGVLAGGHHLARSLDPVANARAAADQMRTLVSSSRRAEVVADVRARIKAGYGMSPQLARAVGRHTVMLWPFVYGEVAYAYDFDLRPAPTLEPYGAYTSVLDRLDGEMLASARAPQRILRAQPAASGAVDGRYPSFEAPLATLQIVCRYRQVTTQGLWQLLARTTRSRCGAPKTLDTVTAAWGEPVAVPGPARPDALVLVHISGAGPRGLEHLTGLALRPAARRISLDGAIFRLVAATAADGLLISLPDGADYPAPFVTAPNPQQIAVSRAGGQPGGDLRYTFEEVPLRPVPPIARAP